MATAAPGPQSRAVLEEIEAVIRPRLRASGPSEVKALLDGLDGKFVMPGPSGAPSRGRLDVLPTGRNFYSVDNRAIPTQTAWELGRQIGGECADAAFSGSRHASQIAGDECVGHGEHAHGWR